MIESDLRLKIKEEWKPCHMTNIEGAYSFGMPDVFITASGQGEWIELKRRYGNSLYFRANQLNWMRRELREGKDTWILWFDEESLCAVEFSVLNYWKLRSTVSKISIKINQEEIIRGDFPAIKQLIFKLFTSDD